MKILSLFLIMIMMSFGAKAQDFEVEAKKLATDLKSSLMKNLSQKIAKDGAVKAISFCHANVGPIAKSAANERMSKYEFGRTSHKLRNKNNKAMPWALSYLKEFQGKFKGDIKKDFMIHRLENGKQVYLEPLYVEAQCLTCHGENVNKSVKTELNKIYPNDHATGFKLSEFRGFIWIKEK